MAGEWKGRSLLYYFIRMFGSVTSVALLDARGWLVLKDEVGNRLRGCLLGKQRVRVVTLLPRLPRRHVHRVGAPPRHQAATVDAEVSRPGKCHRGGDDVARLHLCVGGGARVRGRGRGRVGSERDRAGGSEGVNKRGRERARG